MQKLASSSPSYKVSVVVMMALLSVTVSGRLLNLENALRSHDQQMQVNSIVMANSTTNGTASTNSTSNNSTSGNNSTTTNTGPTGSYVFNASCFACVNNNYLYCAADMTCRPDNYTGCSTANTYTKVSGCPIKQQCNIMGYDGFLRLSDSSSSSSGSTSSSTNSGMVDVSKDGNFSFSVNGSEPCYVTLINNYKAQNSLSMTISGANVSADVMKLNFPFDSYSWKKVSSFTVDKVNDIVFLYVGATQIKDSTAKVSWISNTSVNPSSQGAAYLTSQVLAIASLLVLGLLSI
jgi:hypothetical protein